MSILRVEGGHRLEGSIVPQGAKNECLQVLCATLLTESLVRIERIPLIHDVLCLIDLLEYLGVEVEWNDAHSATFCAARIHLDRLGSSRFVELTGRLRGSLMLAGPLLARFGCAFVPRPGGDKIGRRRLDTHMLGLTKLGATLEYDADRSGYWLYAKEGLTGCYMLLDEASVTGTANIVMASVLARGESEIFNAACEPYLQQLCRLLESMGARIWGIGSNRLFIQGVEGLGGAEHRLLADMIEVGSFVGMAALTASPLRIADADVHELGNIPLAFARMGIELESDGPDLLVPALDHYQIETFLDGSIMTIADAPWPGLTPDLLSVFLVVATQAEGAVLIHQKMFESRLFFVDKLIDMGAQIILCDPHRATVIGLNRKLRLRATSMVSPDIRAGVAMLLAALAADGVSIIHNVDQIDRGYERIDERLNALGARIMRCEA